MIEEKQNLSMGDRVCVGEKLATIVRMMKGCAVVLVDGEENTRTVSLEKVKIIDKRSLWFYPGRVVRYRGVVTSPETREKLENPVGVVIREHTGLSDHSFYVQFENCMEMCPATHLQPVLEERPAEIVLDMSAAHTPFEKEAEKIFQQNKALKETNIALMERLNETARAVDYYKRELISLMEQHHDCVQRYGKLVEEKQKEAILKKLKKERRGIRGRERKRPRD